MCEDHILDTCNPSLVDVHESGHTRGGRTSLRPARFSTHRAPVPRLHAMRRAAHAHLIHPAPLWKRSTCLHMRLLSCDISPRVPQNTTHSDVNPQEVSRFSSLTRPPLSSVHSLRSRPASALHTSSPARLQLGHSLATAKPQPSYILARSDASSSAHHVPSQPPKEARIALALAPQDCLRAK